MMDDCLGTEDLDYVSKAGNQEEIYVLDGSPMSTPKSGKKKRTPSSTPKSASKRKKSVK
jgi:hypothetical protein